MEMSNSSRCRVCTVVTPSAFVDIFHSSSMDGFREAVGALFGFEVQPTDDSTMACEECVSAVNDFYPYFLRVKAAQERVWRRHRVVSVFLPSTPTSKNHHTTLETDHIKLETSESPNSMFVGIEVKKEIDVEQNMDSEEFFSTEDCVPLSKLDRMENLENVDIPADILSDVTNDDVEALSDEIYEFPKTIIENGSLIIRGKALDDLLLRFYNVNCDICNHHPTFENLDKMLHHYKSEHKTEGYVICCNMRFYKHRAMCLHMARHLQPSAFECPVCSKLMSRPYSMKKHLQTHLPNEDRPLKCDKCDKGFTTNEALNGHKITHIPIEEREKLKCQICEKIFTLPSSFAAHMRESHSGGSDKEHLCSECGLSFRKKTDLRVHMITHDTTSQMKCHICGFISKNLRALKIHLKRHGRLLQCNDCEYATHLKSKLNSHIRVKHSNEYPHVCTVCDKKFKLRSVWRIHVSSHKGERNFICRYCSKTFINPSNLHKHRQRHHAKEHRSYILTRQNMKYKPNNMEEIKDIAEHTIEMENNKSKVQEMARNVLQTIGEKDSKRRKRKISE